jgi:predicted acyltransferase
MIIVNTPGSGATPFAPLLHASWHGFTVTDLVFPGFLFAVGNAMSFTKAKLESDSMAFFKILKRTAWIFLLGYLLYWFPYFKSNEAGELILKPISETRIFGVLQRIALCYFFAALMIHYLNSKTDYYFKCDLSFGLLGNSASIWRSCRSIQYAGKCRSLS